MTRPEKEPDEADPAGIPSQIPLRSYRHLAASRSTSSLPDGGLSTGSFYAEDAEMGEAKYRRQHRRVPSYFDRLRSQLAQWPWRPTRKPHISLNGAKSPTHPPSLLALLCFFFRKKWLLILLLTGLVFAMLYVTIKVFTRRHLDYLMLPGASYPFSTYSLRGTPDLQMSHAKQCRVAVISSFPPEKCGIAEFTHTLLSAMHSVLSGKSRHDPHFSGSRIPDCQVSVLVYHDHTTSTFFRNYDPSLVDYVIDLDDAYPSRAMYDAAKFVNSQGYTHVVIQHEFGLTPSMWQQIDLMRWIRPGVSLLSVIHTPRAYPNPEERAHLRQLARLSDHVIVMSQFARHSLKHAYGIQEPEKVTVIPHGVKDLLLQFERNDPRATFEREITTGLGSDMAMRSQFSDGNSSLPSNRSITILTNGLIHAHKGLNRMIRALPELLKRFPNLKFYVAGREHPKSVETNYMSQLLDLASTLGVLEHLVWLNRYVSDQELLLLYEQADLYVTLYDEITPVSGALTAAMAAGLPILSTPYRYASEMLTSHQAGTVLKSFDNVTELVVTMTDLLQNPHQLADFGKKARDTVKRWSWQRIAVAYLALFAAPSDEGNAFHEADDQILLGDWMGEGQVAEEQLLGDMYESEDRVNAASWNGTTVTAFSGHVLLHPSYLKNGKAANEAFEKMIRTSQRAAFVAKEGADGSLAGLGGMLNVLQDLMGADSHDKQMVHFDRFVGKDAQGLVIALYADVDVQVNAVVEPDFRLSAVGIRTLKGWVYLHELYGLDHEVRPTFDAAYSSGPDGVHSDGAQSFAETAPVLDYERGRAVVSTLNGIVEVELASTKGKGHGVNVCIRNVTRFAHPMGLLGETHQWLHDITMAERMGTDSMLDPQDGMRLHERQDWSGWVIPDGFLFSIQSRNQTWGGVVGELRSNVYYVPSAEDLLRHHITIYPQAVPAAQYMRGLSEASKAHLAALFGTAEPPHMASSTQRFLGTGMGAKRLRPSSNETMEVFLDPHPQDGLLVNAIHQLPRVLQGELRHPSRSSRLRSSLYDPVHLRARNKARSESQAAASPFRPTVLVQMEGPMFDHSGFAHVNRQLWFAVQHAPFDVAVRFKPHPPLPSGTDIMRFVKPDGVIALLVVDQYRRPYSSPLREADPALTASQTEALQSWLNTPTGQMEDVAAAQRAASSAVSRLKASSPPASPWGVRFDTAPDIVFRNGWPPALTPPPWPHAKWIHQQPWEFVGIPASWQAPLATAADELWVPSYYCQQGYARCAIPPSTLQVLRHGVNPGKFAQVKGALPLPTRKSFRILFAGGLLRRKGVDVILRAYLQAFTAEDDVSLIIHSVYGDDYFLDEIKAAMQAHKDYMAAQSKGDKQHGKERTASAGNNSTARSPPEVIYLHDELPWVDIVGLYHSVSIFVSPYRSEGFGLMILEAMAAGLPVIVPEEGPALEFTSPANAFYIRTTRDVPCLSRPCGQNTIFGERAVVQPVWSEPDPAALAGLLRRAADMPPAQLRDMANASRRIAGTLDWTLPSCQLAYRWARAAYMPATALPRRYRLDGALHDEAQRDTPFSATD